MYCTLSSRMVGCRSSSILCRIVIPAPSQNVPKADNRDQKYTDFPGHRDGSMRCRVVKILESCVQFGYMALSKSLAQVEKRSLSYLG